MRKPAHARGTFESLSVRKSTLPCLEISVAGDLSEPGLSLETIDLTTKRTTIVSPPPAAGSNWRNACVKAPDGEFKIVARDDSEAKWFAFKEPREVGRLSYWPIQITSAWKFFVVAGLGCLMANLTWLLVRARKATARV